MKQKLTKEVVYQALQKFFDDVPFIMFATGTSCAVDLGFGMPALEQHLRSVIPKYDLEPTQLNEWNNVIELLEDTSDFEAAMNSISDSTLLSCVVNETAIIVAKAQNKNVDKILTEPCRWTANEIVSRLVNKLPQSNPILHMATPNYDLLAEIAMSASKVPYTTGFWGGAIKSLDWKQSQRQMTYPELVQVGRTKKQSVTRRMSHVRLYKVHGSLNVFCKDGEVVECDLWQQPPVNYERLLITPGTSKHEKLHDYRDVLLDEYDEAVRAHNRFLFLGFGFNDTQLVNNAITDKLAKAQSDGLIITRDSNSRIEDLLLKAKNTWLVCKSEQDNSTRIYNNLFDDWLYLEDKELWRFDHFANEIMGR
ncbi:SIR2 family protein [Vibrio splendidus]|uniref:SIR2 family protein n=1 Tax=Vibrio splendidus TaxID=29497 RepID=UPI001E54C521|nr:SIR2 family protein [Vibrio splendidus]